MAPRKKPRYHIDASVGLSEEDKDILLQLGGLGTAPVPALQPAPPPGHSRADLYAAADEDQLAALMEDTGAPDYAARQAAGEISPDAPPNMAYYDQAPQEPATDEESAAYMRATGKTVDDRPPQERANARANFDPASAERNGYNGQVAQAPAQGNARPQMNWEDELLNLPNQQSGFNWGAAIAGGIAGLDGGAQAASQTTLGVNAARQRALAQQQQNAVARARTIQQGQALPLQQAREDRYWKALENSVSKEQNVQHRFETQEERRQRELGLKEDQFKTQQEQFGKGYDQRERFQDRVDARQERDFVQQQELLKQREEQQRRLAEYQTQQHMLRLQQDPKYAYEQQSDMDATKQALNEAVRGWRSLSPQGKDALAQFGAESTLGSFLQRAQLEGPDREKVGAVWGALNELVKQRAGSAVTASEWGRTARELGLGQGVWDPFNSPASIESYLRRADKLIQQRRSSYERIMGGWK